MNISAQKDFRVKFPREKQIGRNKEGFRFCLSRLIHTQRQKQLDCTLIKKQSNGEMRKSSWNSIFKLGTSIAATTEHGSVNTNIAYYANLK